MIINKLWKRLRTIKRNQAGFTFTEMLAATLLLTLSTSLLVQTTSLAYRRYYKSIQKSQALALCQSLSTYVDGELTYASFHTKNGNLKKNNFGAVCFDCDGHNMGDNAYFAIVDDGVCAPVRLKNASGADQVGRLVETSRAYTNRYGELSSGGGYFDILGTEPYEIGNKKEYRLYAGMDIARGAAGEDYSILVNLWIQDRQGEHLAENTIRIIPRKIDG